MHNQKRKTRRSSHAKSVVTITAQLALDHLASLRAAHRTPRTSSALSDRQTMAQPLLRWRMPVPRRCRVCRHLVRFRKKRLQTSKTRSSLRVILAEDPRRTRSRRQQPHRPHLPLSPSQRLEPSPPGSGRRSYQPLLLTVAPRQEQPRQTTPMHKTSRTRLPAAYRPA